MLGLVGPETSKYFSDFLGGSHLALFRANSWRYSRDAGDRILAGLILGQCPPCSALSGSGPSEPGFGGWAVAGPPGGRNGSSPRPLPVPPPQGWGPGSPAALPLSLRGASPILSSLSVPPCPRFSHFL